MFSLSSLTTYQKKWELTNTESLKEADPVGFKQIKSARVVEKEQDWGLSRSICLFMKDSGTKYIPLSSDSKLTDGQRVDIDSITILTLEREGSSPIHRCDAKAI